MLLAGTEDVEAMADFFLKGGVKCVVIKLGSRGCFCKTAQLSFYCGCYDVPVVETTGAGDAFNGGFVMALAEGKDLFTALRYGNVTGALSVTRKGTAPSMPDREAIDRLYAEAYG